MSSAENQTIKNVLILYITSTILLLSTLSYTYYNYQQQELQKSDKIVMKKRAKEIYFKLQNIHNSMLSSAKYPKYKEFNSAIYDIDKNLIYSNLKNLNIDFDREIYIKNSYRYLVYEMTPYYTGSAYIVIEQKPTSMIENIDSNIIILALVIMMIIIVTALFLVKLILKPLRDSVELLDRFIKDTTHELNTPISTILTNIELLQNSILDKKMVKKVDRIQTASLTISNIYDDLVFLVLNHKIDSINEKIEINRLLKDRVEYFNILFKSKKLSVKIDEKDILIIEIDRKKITRLVDNLISNSIKYTNIETNIDMSIDKIGFTIQDRGEGMSKEEIAKIFDRYSRFNKTQGGFGIGYNIIHTIAKEYNIEIEIDSIINEGTCVSIKF